MIDKKPLVYDCITFFNEIEILELRLNILFDYVDYFVIVEANKTHTGIDKEFVFEKNIERFEKFKDKIKYIKLNDTPSYNTLSKDEDGNKWMLENYQRDSIEKGLTNCKDNDIIIISDCDEIINPKIIEKYKKIKKGIYSPVQLRFLYNYNTLCINAPYTKSAKICTYKDLKDPKLKIKKRSDTYCKYSKYGKATYLRFVDCKKLNCGGWHFSYIGDIKTIEKKMNSIVEQQFNSTKYLSSEQIRQKILNNEDILNRGDIYINLKTDKHFPSYLIKNLDKYQKNINKKNQISYNRAKLKILNYILFLKHFKKIKLFRFTKIIL